MKNNLIVFYLIFVLLSISSLEDKPLWVEFQEAKDLYERGDFQEALGFYLDVTKSNTPYPEAEYMIGLLYLEEGELALAKEQVKKAISLSHYLQFPEELLEYRYKLAQIYLLQEDYDNYILTLNEIIGREEIDLAEVRDQKAYFDTLIDSGLNRVLHLYRKKADNVLDARVKLGYYYNSIGKYKESVNYLLSPLIAFISEVIDDNILIDREYIFTSVEIFLKEISNNKRALNYFNEHEVFKVFYYTGESLYGMDQTERAFEIWNFLAESSIDSMWINKARQQLDNPVVEDWKIIY